jgi:general secretion pathway protein A
MYLSYYKLNEEPFRLTPDPRFIHLAPPHRAVLSALLEGVVQHKGIIAFTGPVGTGKTTLLHATLHLLANPQVSKATIASAFILNPTLSREELLEAVLDEFEINCPSTSKPRRLAALHQKLLEMQRKGGTTVLVVDEAHLLTMELMEEIRLLSNTDSYQEKLLQVILCGQPELQALLNRPELRAFKQRVASRCQLRPLTLPDTRAYVAERLHAAGLRGPSPFSSAALEKIQSYTDGVPRLINLLCDACLTLGEANQRNQIGPDFVEEAATTLELTDEAVPNVPPSPAQEGVSQQNLPNSSVDGLIQAMRQYRAEVTPESKVAFKSRQLVAAEDDPKAEVRVLRSVVDVLIDAMRQNRATARE